MSESWWSAALGYGYDGETGGSLGIEDDLGGLWIDFAAWIVLGSWREAI